MGARRLRDGRLLLEWVRGDTAVVRPRDGERRWLSDWGRGRLLGSGGGSVLGQARQVAGGQMAGGGGREQGLLGAAAVEGVGTAGVEAAARGRIDRARHVALEDDALAGGAGVGHR